MSSCLVGQPVRWDGGHKREAFLFDGLGADVELIPVCPEVELGLGIPREPIRLMAGGPGEPVRLIAETTGQDHGQAMRDFARRRIRQLAGLSLSGYVLKCGSPSCGVRGVPLWPAERGANPSLAGRGLFAAALRDAFPELPMEEEDRLRNRTHREVWMTRVRAYHRRIHGEPT